MKGCWRSMFGRLRLTESEFAYFEHRVRTSSKANLSPDRKPSGRARMAAIAATRTFRSRTSCAAFDDGIAYMDHSDEGIRQLFERNGITWSAPEKLQLTLPERIAAATFASLFILANWAGLGRILATNSLDRLLASERFVAGASCFGRFASQARLRPTTWRGLFLTSDVSFLRMFAAFAATRTGRPIAIFSHVRSSGAASIPISIDFLFAFESTVAMNFNPLPRSVSVDVPRARKRQIFSDRKFDCAIVTNNFADLPTVWEVSAQVAGHGFIRSVLVRLHPGSGIRTLPSGLPPNVILSDSANPLSDFAESIDLALVSQSSAVPTLQELLVPCFFIPSFDRNAYFMQDADNYSPAWRYATPEAPEPLQKFLDALSADELREQVRRLEAATQSTRSDPEKSGRQLRDKLREFLAAGREETS